MIAFIDDHRGVYGVEPLCEVLPIAPSTYHAHAARRLDPSKLPARAKHDVALMPQIGRVFEENLRVYGVRKVWWQLLRRSRCSPLHGGALDAPHGPARRDPRQAGPDHDR
jgi:putative transposase